MQSSDLSIYFIISSPPNGFFDSYLFSDYLPLSTSLLINSISRTFYDLPDKNFQILGIGQEKNYTILKRTTKAYYQSGNGKDDIFTISADQNIKFKLFQHINDLYDYLELQIFKNSSSNIIIILQGYQSLYEFNKYQHFKLLFLISKFEEKNFLIYDECFTNGNLFDLFQKNETIFQYFQKHKLNIRRSNITCLYYFALFQSKMFEIFEDNTSTFFPECINFISQLSDDLLNDSIYNVVFEILNAFDRQNQYQDQKKYFLMPIDNDFLDKLEDNSNFDIIQCINANELYFSDLNSFLMFLQNNNIKNLANLLMFKSYYLFTSKPDTQFIRNISFFSEENYKYFFNIENEVFDLLSEWKSTTIKTIEEQKQLYNQILDFFSQYYKYNIIFFEYKSNVDFITCTNLEKASLCYRFNTTSSITKIFHNSPFFAYFIKNVFFAYDKHTISFADLGKHIYYDSTTKKYLIYHSYRYQKLEQSTGKEQLVNAPIFTIKPSCSLPKKIAAVRFLTHFVCNYLSKFQKLDYFPKLNFSSGFSNIPSKLLINFISLTILPKSDAFPSDLKLNNVNFLKVLKFANSVFQTNSIDTSIKKLLKKISINNDRFEFIVFFSVVISSKIRYFFAKNLLLILGETPNFYNSFYLFSIKELEYAKEFLKSEKLNECKNSSVDPIVLFINNLFSVNLIDQYYGVTTSNDDKMKSAEIKNLCEFKKSPRFILQKMFLDLESSILNILPDNIFVFTTIYSYLSLKHHKNIDENQTIQKDVEIIQKNLLEDEKFNDIKEKLKSFNSITDILQFCNNNIYECLQKTYDFLQFFYQSYYIISFCKVSNQYENPTTFFEDFLNKINENIPSNLIEDFFNSLTLKLKPFPLFCFPFILFDKYSYSSYKSDLTTFINNFKSVGHLQNEEKEKYIEILFKNFPNSSKLFELNNFYSEQFRIDLSNLSLYSDLKIKVVENIDILNRFLNAENNDVSNFLSLPFFKNPFPSHKSFKFDCQEIKNYKNVLNFCVDTILENHMKQSISTFINEFVLTTTQFLQFNNDRIIESDHISCSTINDSQLFFYHDSENKVYINSILNNLMDLIDSLSISKPNLDYNIIINEKMHYRLVRLVYSVLESRFNNKVEIDPIIDLIPEYIESFSDLSDWSNPTEEELMALCSAIKLTLSQADKFRKRFYLKSSEMLRKEAKDEVGAYFSSPNFLVGNNRNEFSDIEIRNNSQLVQEIDYKKSIDEALAQSEIEIYDLRKRYDIRHKKWTEIIWSIFYDFFNKKLKEINLNFDKKDKYLQGYACIHCLANENSIIMNYLPQLENMKDFHEKEVWIGRFINLNKNYEYQIKSAYVYALMSSYAFLNTYYTFDGS